MKEGAKTGLRVARDVMSGQNIKTALKERGKEAGKHLFHSAVTSMRGNNSALPAPPGLPAKKRIKRSASNHRSQSQTKTAKKNKKKTNTRRPFDIFS